jgi:DNA-3-methyladenine glycosylase I
MAGLSWLTVLRKREHFRAAFRDFEPAAVARFGARDVARLMNDEGIVRNRAKIDAVINNARRFDDVVEEFGSFAAYAWSFRPARRRQPPDRAALLALATPPQAVAMSMDLRRRGWAFVGPTTVYSFMQAMGFVNDHIRGCAPGREAARLQREFARPR